MMEDYLAAVNEIEAQQDRLETTCTVQGIGVRVWGGVLPDMEIAAYVDRGISRYKSNLKRLDIKVDGENVDIDYALCGPAFERIRRITGYLVGNTTRWNNGKAAELRDRVVHQ